MTGLSCVVGASGSPSALVIVTTRSGVVPFPCDTLNVSVLVLNTSVGGAPIGGVNATPTLIGCVIVTTQVVEVAAQPLALHPEKKLCPVGVARRVTLEPNG